jgi:CBS domain-containing protein
MKTCLDIMTPNPICCLPTDNVKKVAEIMLRENLGPIPVIDNVQSQKVIGILTDRDLVLKVIAKGIDAEKTKVETVMTRKVISCRSDDDVQRAIDSMSEHQLRRIIVVDEVNKILGIISQADVATRTNEPQKTAEMVKDVSQASGK